MVNIADKIFDFLRKRFSLANRRFPTPAESEDLLNDAQKIVNDAVQNNLIKYGDEASPQDIISKTLSQDAQKIIDDATPFSPLEGTAPKPKAQIEALPLEDPELRQQAIKKKLEAMNEQTRAGRMSTADQVSTGPAARSKVQRDKEGLESLGDQIPVRDDTARPTMPMKLIENFGTEFQAEELIKQGYTPTQADILVKARKKLIEGEEMNPNEALLRVKEEMADDLGIDVDDVDIDFQIEEPDKFAEGGSVEKTPSERFIEMYRQGKYNNLQTAIDDSNRYERGEMTDYERIHGRKPFAGGGAAKKLIEKLTRQSKSPFGRMAMKESGQALPKGVESGSLMGDIIEGVNRIEDLLGNTKSLPQSRFEIADFVMNMRKDGFSNDAIIDIVQNYGPQYSLKSLRTRIAPQVKIANDLGAKTSAQRNFIVEMEDTKDIYTPSEFRDTLKEGDLKYMVSDAMEKDFMAKGLNEDDATYLASLIRSNPDNIFEGFAKVKNRAFYDFDIEVDDIVDFYEKAYGDYILPQTKRYKQSYAGGGIASKITKQFNKAKKKNPKLSNEDFAQEIIDAEKADKMGIQTVEEFENMQKLKKEAQSKRKTYDELPADKKKRKTLRLKKAEGGLAYLVGF